MIPRVWSKAVNVPSGYQILIGAEMHSWLTIDTAPKDGTAILACAEGREYVPTTAYWAAYHPNATGKQCWRTSKICGNKIEGLTHWMPLPSPPEKS